MNEIKRKKLLKHVLENPPIGCDSAFIRRLIQYLTDYESFQFDLAWKELVREKEDRDGFLTSLLVNEAGIDPNMVNLINELYTLFTEPIEDENPTKRKVDNLIRNKRRQVSRE